MNTNPLASALATMAGSDSSLPGNDVCHEKEWVFAGDYSGDLTGVLLSRLVGVGEFKPGDVRTTYVLITGYGYKTDAYHCYPKSQWTREEAAEFHAREH